MFRKFAALAAAIVVLAPLPAFAAWDWTNWTMSARDVIDGSGGRLKPAHGGPNDTVNGWWLRAVGDIQQDGFAFDGEFYFDKKGKALHVIRLSLKNPGDCRRLTRVLTERHGEPVDRSSPMFGVILTVIEWPDDGQNNYLALTALPPVGDQPAMCFIRYRPIAEGAT